MKLSFSVTKGGASSRISIDTHHKRVSTADEDLLDAVNEGVDWALSQDKEAFKAQVRDLLQNSGYSIAS